VHDDTGADTAPPVCSTCGAVPADEEASAVARLSWTRGTEQGREVWTCDECSRRHLRSIGGKLDSDWW
jgi:Zn-finger protein